MSDNVEILKALPVLQKIWNTPTLSNYFKNTISSLYKSMDLSERKCLIDAIAKEVKRLYGDEVANEISHQITDFPVIETGTHLAFLRDYDSLKKDDARSRLNQNILISSSLMRYSGQKYHIGVYGTDVNLNHPCGGGFFQLGDDIFPVTSLREIGQMCLYDAPKIKQEYFNESLLITEKLKMLNEVLTDEIIDKTSTPQREVLAKAKKITFNLLGPIKDGKMNFKDVEKQYNYLNFNSKKILKTSMLLMSKEVYRKYGYTFSDVERQYKELYEIFNRENLNLPDQVALVQSNTINKILNGTGINHVSIDAVEVVRKFLISELENKGSLWYNIFNKEENFKKLHNSFIGIRGSWKENESPFDYVIRHKGFSKCLSLPLEKLNHKPESILPLLKEKKIIPSCALIILAFQSSNILAHGGFFQTTYADKIKKRFVNFLNDIGEIQRVEELKKLPVDMALLSLAVINDKTKQPMKLSEISRMSESERIGILDMVPEYPSCQAVLNALPILRKYLDTTAPGYIESEAANSKEPQIIFHSNKILNSIPIIKKDQILREVS